MAPFLSREWFDEQGATKLRARIRSILLSLFWEQGDEKEKRAMKELPAYEEWRKERTMPWPPAAAGAGAGEGRSRRKRRRR